MARVYIFIDVYYMMPTTAGPLSPDSPRPTEVVVFML